MQPAPLTGRAIPRLAGLLAFIRGETAGGAVLVLSAVVAILWANSPWTGRYDAMLHLPVALTVGSHAARADLHFVVNDALMSVFFLLVGLEIRRELTEGQLASLPRAAAPAIAATGGMVVPALIFIAFCHADREALRGWAIPVATDIAFSLAVLRLLGARIPSGLKVFLTALAIIDDLGAILVIAVFYTAEFHLPALAAAAIVWLGVFALNRAQVRSTVAYTVAFILLWACLVRSGVHATLAGVAFAFAVPMTGEHSVGRSLEHALNGWVSFLILPLFGLFNAGLHFNEIGWATLADPVVPGIAVGLFAGKQIGVFGAARAASFARLIDLPAGLRWSHIYGASVLCGIGFTMSLFIGQLAYESGERVTEMKLAVFAGSLVSAAAGVVVLLYTGRRNTKALPSHSEKGELPAVSSVKP